MIHRGKYLFISIPPDTKLDLSIVPFVVGIAFGFFILQKSTHTSTVDKVNMASSKKGEPLQKKGQPIASLGAAISLLDSEKTDQVLDALMTVRKKFIKVRRRDPVLIG